MKSEYCDLLNRAVAATRAREFWTPFPEIPSGKFYGETAKADGLAAFESLLGHEFELLGHPGEIRVGAEVSPWGAALAIRYPSASPEALVEAAQKAQLVWAETSPEARAGVVLEALNRLNRMSFVLGHATMHTTGQAFAMAFQAGGPHAQDRGLEAVAMAWDEMHRSALTAIWEKPAGRAGMTVIDKEWRLVPRGLSLMIGCNTFPTWNGYPGLFASLVTGNAVVVKPHPRAILPLALTVRVLRDCLSEAGLPIDAVLLAADEPGSEMTKELVATNAFAMIDYTGSQNFGDWLRANAGTALLFTEETGVNPVAITGTSDFRGMCANLSFSLALYSGQMCTSPQNLYIPRLGIETDEGWKSFDEIGAGIAAAIDKLLEDPARAAQVTGMIVNPDAHGRIEMARKAGNVIRNSGPVADGSGASPLMVQVESDTGIAGNECFGPVSFVVPCDGAVDAIERAAAIAGRKGAITAALYATSPDFIEQAGAAFARAGVNLSVNLTGDIYVNQSAAFSDFHVTGANPAGNACLTDGAFVSGRFRRVMIRRPRAA